jgi:ABC-type glycerol-3-phosphate transport system permease component
MSINRAVESNTEIINGHTHGSIKMFITLGLLGGAFLSIIPFYWMIINSFKSNHDIFAWPPILKPTLWNWSNYLELFHTTKFMLNAMNSLFIAISFTLLSVFLCALAGFAFAKYKKAPGANFLFILLLSPMMIPQQVLVIPLFILINRLGWNNSYQSVFVPFAASAFGMFLLKQYIESIPDDLLEAARIDGCMEYRIFLRIILPLIKPALAALAIIQFMYSWNDFLWPLIVLRTEDKFTIPLVLAQLQGKQYGIPYHLIMTGCTLATMPLIFIFFGLQKYFVAGATMGAIKQ